MAPTTLTDLLSLAAEGDGVAHSELFRQVYDELRRIARAHIRRSSRDMTINPTTLVHESWIKFSRIDKKAIENSAHFYNVLAQAMRHILHDLSDRKRAEKHGGALVRTELSERIEQDDKPIDELLVIEAALDELRACDDELCTILEWHYFAGLSVAEIAELRQLSDRTAKRRLAMGRALLQDILKGRAA